MKKIAKKKNPKQTKPIPAQGIPNPNNPNSLSHGDKTVNINGQSVKVGLPMTIRPL